jgi:hypothetical protein
MRMTFPSVTKPNIRYSFYENDSDNKGYNWAGSSYIISRYLAYWDTLGDGETQHSQDCCPSTNWDNMWDFVISVLPHASKAEGEIADNLLRTFVPYTLPSAEQMDFCRKQVYDPEKWVYANFEECKRSTHESKRHDKRWTQLDSCMDGSIRSVRLILSNHVANYKHMEPLASVFLDIHIANHFGESHYSVSRQIEKGNKRTTIFAGSTEEQLTSFCWYVEVIGKMMQARKDLQRFADIASREAVKAREVAAA